MPEINFAQDTRFTLKWVRVIDHDSTDKLRTLITNDIKVSECKILKKKNRLEVLYPISTMDFTVYSKWQKGSVERGSFKLRLWPPRRKSIQFNIEDDTLVCW